MNIRTSLLVSATLLSAAGCFTVKTESEIKPIHITMDVNLKVDKELDKAFADENMAKPKGDFTVIKDLIDRKVAGVSNKALLEARTGATDDDRIIMVITTAFVSMPSFIMGTLLLFGFAVKWPLFPAHGGSAAGLVLPIITLGLSPMANITRLTRSSMLDVLGQDYIRTAKAKGVSGTRIIFGHALKNALIPVITYFGPMLAYIVTGSLVIEQIFAVPGIGRAFVQSIINRDYPMVMGTTILLAALIVVMNLLSDIAYKIVDPRIDFN